jgi:hypothetical protein
LQPCHNRRGRASEDEIGGSGTYHLKRRYEISAADADADAMLVAQNGLCAICKAAPAAHVGHDYETGDVRALLCFTCNGGLGQIEDDRYLRHVAAFQGEHPCVRQALQALSDGAHTGPRGPAARGSRR